MRALRTYGPLEPMERESISYGAVALPDRMFALAGAEGIPVIEVRQAIPRPSGMFGRVSFTDGEWHFEPLSSDAKDLSGDQVEDLVARVVRRYSKGLRS